MYSIGLPSLWSMDLTKISDIDLSKNNSQYLSNKCLIYIVFLRIIPHLIYFFISGPPFAYAYDFLKEIITS